MWTVWGKINKCGCNIMSFGMSLKGHGAEPVKRLILTKFYFTLCQGYVHEKRHASQTQNSHLNWCSVWLPLVVTQTCRVYMCCICSVYTFLYSIHTFLCLIFIYLFLYCSKNVRDWCHHVTNIINLYTWLWCHFLLACCRSAATYRLCQISFNQKLPCEFKKWNKFSSRIKEK